VNTLKTSIRMATVAVGVGAALAVGVGAASAFTVSPLPGGNKIDLTRDETVALGNAHVVAPVLNTVLPVRLDNGLLLGDGLQRSLDLATAAPGGSSGANVYGPILAPSRIDLYHYSQN
jgi:hypothetical protein